MLSLVLLCSRRVVSDHGVLRGALPLVPEELYPALFRAAFLDKKPLVLRDLVQRWPFPVLSLRRLLQSDGRLCQNKLCVQSVILGVMAYLQEALAGRREGRPLRRLRLLDMTGARDDALEQGPDSMTLWSRTVLLAKCCIQISRCQEASERSEPEGGAGCSAVHVEVRADLFVNSTSYGVLREALQLGSQGPLRLCCRDMRAEELSLRSTVGLLQLLNPAGLRQIDLRFNNLGLLGLNALLPHVTRFCHLQSLKLPYSNVDVRRLTPALEEALQNLSSLISQLPALQELNLGSSRLSGRLCHLLGALRTPLQSLELAFCSLLPADLLYLSRSVHVSSLQKLDLSGNNLSSALLPPFLQLLDAAAPSLLHLDVMECKLSDSAMSALTPVLRRCRCLRYLGLFCNLLSAQGIRTLLQNSLQLAELQLVIYPFPSECYLDPTLWPDASTSALDSLIDPDKAAQFEAEVQAALVSARRTDVVWTTDMASHRPPEYLSL